MGLWSAMRSRLLCRLVAVLMTVGVGSVIALTLELASPTEAFAKDKAKKKKPKKFTYAQRGNSAKVSVRARKPARTRVETPRFYSKEVKTIGELEPISLKMQDGVPVLTEIPRFSSQFQGRIAGRTPDNKVLYFTIDPGLQAYAQQLVDRAAAPHIAIVAMDPETGRLLAVAAKSQSIKELATHNGFPAASLFKIITSAAAIERGGVQPWSPVRFRGGNYTLNELNYKTNDLLDRRVMTMEEGLGKSCNPVFARLALNYLNSPVLRYYAKLFGFNSHIDTDIELPESSAFIPSEEFDFSRAAAGFGDVYISPIHAAVMMSQVAAGGQRPRPFLVDQMLTQEGKMLYQARPQSQSILRPATARTLLEMMEATTTIGTSRREFMRNNRPVFPNLRVAAKTGTLTGGNPGGLNHWFIAAAPIEDPKLAIAIIAVDARGAEAKASRLGRKMFARFFNLPSEI